MTAVTTDQLAITKASPSQAIEYVYAIKTSVTVNVGTLVNLVVATGRVRSAAAETGNAIMVAGRCTEIINDSGAIISAGTGNAGGTIKARVVWNDMMLLSVKTAIRTFTNVGKTVFVADNVTVGGTAVGSAGVRVQAGMLADFANAAGAIDGTKAYAWIKLRDCTGAIIAV